MSATPYQTIVDAKNFYAALAAEKLSKALALNDIGKVIDSVASISNDQRQELRVQYQLKYGKNLMDVLKKMMLEHQQMKVMTAIEALMELPLDYDVRQIKKAILAAKNGNNSVLISILCTNTSAQLHYMSKEYIRQFDQTMQNDIATATTGELRDLLVAVASGIKEESNNTNDEEAESAAIRILNDERNEMTKEGQSHFLTILSTHNRFQLRKVFKKIEEMSGSKIQKLVQKEFNGDLKQACLIIVDDAQDKQKMYAEKLYIAMGADEVIDEDLTRILVKRSEVDLVLIQEDFLTLYAMDICDAINETTSGHYRDLLLKLVHGNRDSSHLLICQRPIAFASASAVSK